MESIPKKGSKEREDMIREHKECTESMKGVAGFSILKCETPGDTTVVTGGVHEHPHLKRLLLCMRGESPKGKYIIICTKVEEEWRIAKLSGIHPGLKGSTVRLTADPQALHLFHKGNSLLYRDGTDLPPYQPRTARAAGSMGGDRGAAAMPADRNGQDRNGGRDGEDGDRIEDGLIKPEGPVR